MRPPITGRGRYPASQLAGLCGDGGEGWIRTSVRLRGQIYSLLPLTTRPPLQVGATRSQSSGRVSMASRRAMWRPDGALSTTTQCDCRRLAGARRAPVAALDKLAPAPAFRHAPSVPKSRSGWRNSSRNISITHIWLAPMDKWLKILIPVVRALARALARRGYKMQWESSGSEESPAIRRASSHWATTNS